MNKLVEVARRFIGVKEEGGDNKGKQVEEFQRAVDGNAQGEAWCMAFAQFCIKKAQSEDPTLVSKIYLSEHCLTVWNKTPKEQRLKEPEAGCLMIWQFGETSNGHVAIVETPTKTHCATIEGNTGTGQGVERNGDGVYDRTRSRKGSEQMKVLGYLKVF